MATILLTWELGGGLGHLYPLQMLGGELAARGHCVVAAVRDASLASRVFRESGVRFVQAPVKLKPSPNRIEPLTSYAHVLHNTGWGDAEELQGLFEAWTNLIELVDPDVALLDHSPIAALALRGLPIATIACGTGFYFPPDAQPLPRLHPSHVFDAEQAWRDEQAVLERANRVLKAAERPQLAYLARLYHEVDARLFLTFPELDHFGVRPGEAYLGTLPSGGRRAPEWTNAEGPRIYAYLIARPGVEGLLHVLKGYRCSVCAVCPGLPEGLLHRLQGDNLRILDTPIDVTRAAAECDFAVTYASHGVTAALLLAGKPVVQLPFHLEQLLVAERVVRGGAGLLVQPNEASFIQALNRIREEPSFRRSAMGFAYKYRSHTPTAVAGQVADIVEHHLNLRGEINKRAGSVSVLSGDT